MRLSLIPIIVIMLIPATFSIADVMTTETIDFQECSQASLEVTNNKIYWSSGRLDKSLFFEYLSKKNALTGLKINKFSPATEGSKDYSGSHNFGSDVLNYSVKGISGKFSLKMKNGNIIKGEFQTDSSQPPEFALIGGRLLMVVSRAIDPDYDLMDCAFYDIVTGQNLRFGMERAEIKLAEKFKDITVIVFGNPGNRSINRILIPLNDYVIFNEKKNVFMRFPVPGNLLDARNDNNKLIFVTTRGLFAFNPLSGESTLMTLDRRLTIHNTIPVSLPVYDEYSDTNGYPLLNFRFTNLQLEHIGPDSHDIRAYFYTTNRDGDPLIEIDTSYHWTGTVSNDFISVITNHTAGLNDSYSVVFDLNNSFHRYYVSDTNGSVIYENNRRGIYPLSFPLTKKTPDQVYFEMNRRLIQPNPEGIDFNADRQNFKILIQEPKEAALTGDNVYLRNLDPAAFRDWEKSADDSKEYSNYPILSRLMTGDTVFVLIEKGKWSFVNDVKNQKSGWIYNKYLKAKV